jgi:peptidyl-prolyl cis-trans isomerase D
MLRNFRQVFKGQKTPMTVVMGIVLLGLVAYLAPSSGQNNAPDNVVARVYGREVVYRELYDEMMDMMQQFGKQASTEALRPYIQGQALNKLISAKLVEELADSRGIIVTDAEVRSRMEALFRSAPGFTNPDGSLKSSEEINNLLLESPRRPMTLLTFERQMRKDLVRQKLITEAAALVPVDAAWLAHENRVRNEKLSLDVYTLAPDTTAVADPGEGALQTFMKSQGERFQVPPRRVLTYVSVDQAAFGKALEPDEMTLKTAYASKKAQYTELRTSHILLKGANETELAQASRLLQDVRAKVLAGADFAKLAEAMSQDPSAKTNRGDNGFMKHGALVKPFEDAAMALKVGELSQPVRTSFGVHLIQLTDRKERSFEEVKGELRAQLVQERFTAKAKEKLEGLRKLTGEKGDLARAAKTQSLVVRTSTPLLDEPATQIEGLPGSGILVGEAFRLAVGQVSKVQKVGDAYVVFRVQEERPTAIPPLAEIRAKVLEAYRLEQARKTASARAQAALQGGDVTALGAPTAQDSKSITELGEAAQHPGLVKALLETGEGRLTPPFWTPDGKLWMARLRTRVPAEPLTFEKRQTLVRELQEAAANKLLGAEIMDLDAKGRQRSNWSTLWGRLGGIYVNEDILKIRSDESE